MDYSLIWQTAAENDKKRLAAQSEPFGVRKITDIPYKNDNSEYHLLDVYYPEDCSQEKLPVIIDIHGGGWVYGSKEINRIYCMNLAKHGFTVFNINYRLIPECTFADQMNDVSVALKWIYENMNLYPCNSEKVYLTGDSAGGQLAAYSSVINKDDELCRLFSFEKSGLHINALGLVSPNLYLTPFDFKNVYFRRLLGKDYKNLPFVNYLTIEALLEKASIPPAFFVTSAGDYMALRQTEGAYNTLTEKGCEAVLLNFEGEQGKELAHAFSVLEPEKEESKITIEKMLEFFQKH